MNHNVYIAISNYDIFLEFYLFSKYVFQQNLSGFISYVKYLILIIATY